MSIRSNVTKNYKNIKLEEQASERALRKSIFQEEHNVLTWLWDSCEPDKLTNVEKNKT